MFKDRSFLICIYSNFFEKATPLSANDATKACTEGLADAKDGLTATQYANAVANCISDMTV